jgi:hypothetical protein
MRLPFKPAGSIGEAGGSFIRTSTIASGGERDGVPGAHAGPVKEKTLRTMARHAHTSAAEPVGHGV